MQEFVKQFFFEEIEEKTKKKIFQVVHALSANMNVNLKVGVGEDWDWREFPVPTQFVAKFGPGRKALLTEVSDIYQG